MANQVLAEIEPRMRKTAEGLKTELASIRTGRAAPSLIEHLKVEYAGATLPLNQIAGISAPEARLLLVQPWDKSSLRNIEKALMSSDLGLTPINDGNILRIKIPELSEERRQELIKVVKKRIEERKVTIRNQRREAMEQLKTLEKDKEISQDEHKRDLNSLQKITDGFIDTIDQIGQDKESELKQV